MWNLITPTNYWYQWYFDIIYDHLTYNIKINSYLPVTSTNCALMFFGYCYVLKNKERRYESKYKHCLEDRVQCNSFVYSSIIWCIVQNLENSWEVIAKISNIFEDCWSVLGYPSWFRPANWHSFCTLIRCLIMISHHTLTVD